MAATDESGGSAFRAEIVRTLRGEPETLASLRAFLRFRKDVAVLLPEIASYPVVVDANVLIGDLLWIVKRRKNPRAKSAILECMIAGTFVAYATSDVIAEVERNMAAIARERGFADSAWMPHWNEYRCRLKIENPEAREVERFSSGRDPSDAPTLALADIVSACGILSVDKDIAAMGGNVLPGTFKIEARGYSRNAAVSFSLKIGGIYCSAAAFEVLALAARGIRRGLSGAMALPPALKAVLVGAAVLAILHPASRAALVEAVKAIRCSAGEALKVILVLLVEANEIAHAHRAVPPLVPTTGRNTLQHSPVETHRASDRQIE